MDRPSGSPARRAGLRGRAPGRSKGVFITTSRFTEDATDYVTRVQPRVVLIDGRRLADLMIEYGVGVSRFRSYELKRVDEDYFVEDEGSGPVPSGVASDAVSDAL
jgi:restriction endonuclease Mrr